jgi:hypothetical protein
LKARTVEPEGTPTARQSLGKHVPAATNMQASREKLLEAVFVMQSMPKLHTEEFSRVEL